MKNTTEIWLDIPGYEGFYQVSSTGSVKSLDRRLMDGRSKKGKVLKPTLTKRGYLRLELNKDGFKEKIGIHQIVAMAFKGHIRSGYNQVVNHKDFNPLNNNEDNIEVTTQRDNANHKHLPSSSECVGVSWDPKARRFKANIWIDRALIHLGSYNFEQEAHDVYQEALKVLNINLAKAYDQTLTDIKAFKL